MIGKLKMRCGAQFTSKMEGMMNDLSIGAEHKQDFLRYLRTVRGGPASGVDASSTSSTAIPDVELEVQVLTTGYWPTYGALDVALPPVMHLCTQIFKEYYDTKTSHRRLQWVHRLGGATVRGQFRRGAYDMQVCCSR